MIVFVYCSGELSRNAEVDYPILVEEEPLSTTSLPLAVVTESQQNLDHQNELLPSPTTLYEEHPKESTSKIFNQLLEYYFPIHSLFSSDE